MENNEFDKFLKELNNENLYSILKITQSANPLELREGFKKTVKKSHPDKVPESMKAEASNLKF